MRKLALSIAMSSVLGAGIARAQTDMALEQEADARQRFADSQEDNLERLRLDAIRGAEIDIFNQPGERRTGLLPELGLPYGIVDEVTLLKNPQSDIYAGAADLISPLPDRLSVNPESAFYGEYGKVGVRFDGSDRPGDVEEYCVSEGWIRVRTFMANGKPKKERGKFVCLKRFGKVEPYRK